MLSLSSSGGWTQPCLARHPRLQLRHDDVVSEPVPPVSPATPTQRRRDAHQATGDASPYILPLPPPPRRTYLFVSSTLSLLLLPPFPPSLPSSLFLPLSPSHLSYLRLSQSPPVFLSLFIAAAHSAPRSSPPPLLALGPFLSPARRADFVFAPCSDTLYGLRRGRSRDHPSAYSPLDRLAPFTCHVTTSSASFTRPVGFRRWTAAPPSAAVRCRPPPSTERPRSAWPPVGSARISSPSPMRSVSPGFVLAFKPPSPKRNQQHPVYTQVTAGRP